YNAFGWFDQVEGPLKFKHLKDWNEWQLNYIAEQSNHEAYRDELTASFVDQVELLISENDAPYVKHGISTIKWLNEALYIKAHKSNIEMSIPFDELEALNVHMHNKLDFFIGNKLI